MTKRSGLWLAGAAAAFGLAACGEEINAANLAPPPEGVDQAFDGLPGDPALADIRSLNDPQAELAGAQVRDSEGRAVGSVDRVELAADGVVEALVIELAGGGLVRANPLEARYDERVDTVELTVDVQRLDAAG